jgi:hypothetical protein
MRVQSYRNRATTIRRRMRWKRGALQRAEPGGSGNQQGGQPAGAGVIDRNLVAVAALATAERTDTMVCKAHQRQRVEQAQQAHRDSGGGTAAGDTVVAVSGAGRIAPGC